jgi:hypothetical protein
MAKRRRVSSLGFFGALCWLDSTPLLDTIEPYRRRLFTAALDTIDGDGRLHYNLVLSGRAKKNFKSCDAVLAALYALLANDSPGGNQCYLLANDEGQAGDDLTLAKKLVSVNPLLADALIVKQKTIERADGRGFLEILPAGDVLGSHGKTFRICCFDEIHGYRTWDLLEAMQLDPTRADAQQWITSYASLFHKPGVPLYDLCAAGRAGSDPRMLFSWYAADYCTDGDYADADPESRANPSRGSFVPGYLAQQQARLPAHKYRRLHLNLPGLPEGSAFQVEPVLDAIERGVRQREPEPGLTYVAFVDMSGGSNDDAVLAIAHRAADQRIVLDLVLDQGPPPPFDPRMAVHRFAGALRRYNIRRVHGDPYAGETFRADFQRDGITYQVVKESPSELYEALEPPLNGRTVSLLDLPRLEQQLLGLIWRGRKIDHPSGEHDDWSNAVAGCVRLCAAPVGSILNSIHAIDPTPALADAPTGERGWRAIDSLGARFMSGA